MIGAKMWRCTMYDASSRSFIVKYPSVLESMSSLWEVFMPTGIRQTKCCPLGLRHIPPIPVKEASVEPFQVGGGGWPYFFKVHWTVFQRFHEVAPKIEFILHMLIQLHPSGVHGFQRMLKPSEHSLCSFCLWYRAAQNIEESVPLLIQHPDQYARNFR